MMDSSRNPLGFQDSVPPDSLLREVENRRELLTVRTYLTSKINFCGKPVDSPVENPC